MFNDLLKSFTQQEGNELETNEIKIKNNTIAFDTTAIQIHNISMLTRNEFNTPVTLKDVVILGILLAISVVPPFLGFLVFAIYAYHVYNKHKQHLKTKYFITLNLGSSQNYRLFFPNYEFRDKVYETLIKSFNSKSQNIIIDMSKQEIETATFFEAGATQHNVTGDNNIVDNTLGDHTVISFGGDVNQQSNVSKHSPGAMQRIELPWEDLTSELETLINQNSLSEEIKASLNELKASCQDKNIEKFSETVQNNKNTFNKEFIQNTLSGTLSGVVATILTLPLIK